MSFEALIKLDETFFTFESNATDFALTKAAWVIKHFLICMNMGLTVDWSHFSFFYFYRSLQAIFALLPLPTHMQLGQKCIRPCWNPANDGQA